jgi:hypothetical protein
VSLSRLSLGGVVCTPFSDVCVRFAGLLKGIGKGLVGAVAAPVVGTLGAFSRVTEGVDATVRPYSQIYYILYLIYRGNCGELG